MSLEVTRSGVSVSVTEDKDIFQLRGGGEGGEGEEEDGYRTPTSEEHKIPEISSPPSPPRKPKWVAKRKRKSSQLKLKFFEIDPEDVERLFREDKKLPDQRFPRKRKRCF